MNLDQGTLSIKIQRANILVIVGHTGSEFVVYRKPLPRVQMSECGSAPIKLYL